MRYGNSTLSIDWTVTNSSFDTLHGVDVSYNGQMIFVSGRGDGYIHVFDNSGNYISNLSLGSMAMLGGLAIEKKGTPYLGDLNNDNSTNIFDIVLSVESILSPMMISPYQGHACDINEDNNINVSDIVLLVNLVLSF